MKVNKARFGREEQKSEEVRRSGKKVEAEGGSTVQGITFKNALTVGKSLNPVMKEVFSSLEVQPSEELLEFMKWGFVGELHQHMDVREVRQALVMEGLHRVKVTRMGDKLLLLHIEGVADI